MPQLEIERFMYFHGCLLISASSCEFKEEFLYNVKRMPQILRSVLPGDVKQIADLRVVIAQRTGVSSFLELHAMNAPWIGIGRQRLFE